MKFQKQNILITGAGGFLGWHLSEYLHAQGHNVTGIDLHTAKYAPHSSTQLLIRDVRNPGWVPGAKYDVVYALAADMGGMGYISQHSAEILANNLRVNLSTVEAVRLHKISRVVFASSACVYNELKQDGADSKPLTEDDAYPALPDTEYGWEKLISERLYQAYAKAYGFTAHIVRFHNVFGPYGSWNDGREKAPAAICRKVAEHKAKRTKEIEVWGDGQQRRSFLYVGDWLKGLQKLVDGNIVGPINLGSADDVSIAELVAQVCEIAGVKDPVIKFIPGPQGVRARNSDNTLIKKLTEWEPPANTLNRGLKVLYPWIEEQVWNVRKT